MNKQTLSKIKIKKEATILETKDQHDYQMYAKYRNQSQNTCRKAVTDYEKSLSREVKSNPKAFFKYALNKLNFKNAIPDLVDNGKIISNNNGKAKAFNIFFKSVFTKESDSLPDLNLNVKSSVKHVPFQTDNVKQNLDNLNPSKSPGVDGLHPRILK